VPDVGIPALQRWYPSDELRSNDRGSRFIVRRGRPASRASASISGGVKKLMKSVPLARAAFCAASYPRSLKGQQRGGGCGIPHSHPAPSHSWQARGTLQACEMTVHPRHATSGEPRLVRLSANYREGCFLPTDQRLKLVEIDARRRGR
jgi:hypothetical protein